MKPHFGVLFAAALATILAGCETMQTPPVTVATQTSVVALYQQPAKRAMFQGLWLYEQASLDAAERAFVSALETGLDDRQDMVAAYKYLAFIDCAYGRLDPCEQHFRAAFAVDPAFTLTRAEVGHPVWGPVYRHVLESQIKKK